MPQIAISPCQHLNLEDERMKRFHLSKMLEERRYALKGEKRRLLFSFATFWVIGAILFAWVAYMTADYAARMGHWEWQDGILLFVGAIPLLMVSCALWFASTISDTD